MSESFVVLHLGYKTTATMASSLWTYAVIASLLLTLILRLKPKKTPLPQGTKLPPGPPGLPFLGNLLSLPLSHSWLHFRTLTDTYGPLVRLTIAGQRHLLIGRESIANDLLRERGTIYSDRYLAPAATQLLCDGEFLLFLPYGEKWRRERRFMHQLTMSSAAAGYRSEQRIEAVRMVRDLLRDPGDYQAVLERFSVGLGMRLLYGQRLESGHDEDCRRILGIVHELERVGSPGSYFVDVFPWMMRVPDWLAPWKRYLKGKQVQDEVFFLGLVERTRRDMQAGKNIRSFARTWLESREKWGLSEREAAWMFGSVFDAAATSTSSLMASFILAMVRNPKWFDRLQEEMDGVVGPERLPTYDDIPHLPLLRACVKETFRFYPVTAGGFPHKSTQDDVYQGYFIEKGTIVHPVQWAIHRDPELYPDPDTFNPERWLDPKYPTYREPLTVYPNLQSYSGFGFGRRLCQGMNIAEASADLQVAYLAWGTRIARKKDEQGLELIPPEYDFSVGFNVAPNRFDFELQERGKDRTEVIERAYQKSLAEDPLLS